MLKFIGISLISIVIFSQNIQAQSWVDNLKEKQKLVTASDPKAKKILDKVSANYKSYKNISAAFKLKLESTTAKVSEEQTGKIYLSGNKYKLEMKGQDIICDSKTMWTYLKDAKEVQVNYYDANAQSLSPSQLFTIYEKGFLYVYAGEEKDKSGNIQDVIDFTPNDKSKPYFKIKINIDRNTSQMKSARIFEKNGNKYIYTLTSFETNKTLSDTFFSWDEKANPGVSVIDLR